MQNALVALIDYAQLLLGLQVAEIPLQKQAFHGFVRGHFCKLVAEKYLQDTFWHYINTLSSQAIYAFTDLFQINILVLHMEEHLIVFGPFMQNVADEKFCEMVKRTSGIRSLPQEMQTYYYSLPVCTLPTVISMAQLFLSHVYDSPVNAPVHRVSPFTKSAGTAEKIAKSEHADLKQLSQRYAMENTILSEVACGNAVGALKGLKQFLDTVNHITYISDPIANQKKLNTIYNTLLRKTIEHAKLDLVSVDRISAKFSYQTENTNTLEGLRTLQYDMVSSYCALVKNNSLRNFSPIVRKALCYIHEMLGEQVQLAEIARACDVSPNYLSARFNQETGCSIAVYINRKRVDKIVDLLQNTNRSISDIAAYVGFTDLNYCIKVFKKSKGVSPGAFRRQTTLEDTANKKIEKKREKRYNDIHLL